MNDEAMNLIIYSTENTGDSSCFMNVSKSLKNKFMFNVKIISLSHEWERMTLSIVDSLQNSADFSMNHSQSVKDKNNSEYKQLNQYY